MRVIRYVVLAPFNGWKKGALLDHAANEAAFWVDKGFLARIELDESEVPDPHAIVHGRPKNASGAEKSAHSSREQQE